MSLVKVKGNQVELPTEVRVQLGISEGDVLEIDARDGQIVLTKAKIDPEHLNLIKEGLDDYEAGNVSEGFDDMDDLLAYVNDSA